MDTDHLEDLREYRPRTYQNGSASTQYWLQNGKIRCGGGSPIRGADPRTFVFYESGFAMDAKWAYQSGRRLAKSNGATFRPLNYCYYTDGQQVWTVGGVVPTTLVDAFRVLDRGYTVMGSGRKSAQGYATDGENVFYESTEGKPSILRGADPATFKSIGDCIYGRDARKVFCRKAALKKADPRTWRPLDEFSHYSRDKARVFYDNRVMPGVDPDELEVIAHESRPLAKTKDAWFHSDREVTFDEFRKLMSSNQGP